MKKKIFNNTFKVIQIYGQNPCLIAQTINFSEKWKGLLIHLNEQLLLAAENEDSTVI